MVVSNRQFIFQLLIFRGHVSFREGIFFVERYFLIPFQDLVVFFNLKPPFLPFLRQGFQQIWRSLWWPCCRGAGVRVPSNPWFPWRFFSMFFSIAPIWRMIYCEFLVHIITYPCFFFNDFSHDFCCTPKFREECQCLEDVFFSDASCMPPPKPLATQQVGRVFTPEMSTPT